MVGPLEAGAAPWKAVKAGQLEPREALGLFLAWVRFSVGRWRGGQGGRGGRTLLRVDAPANTLVSALPLPHSSPLAMCRLT